MRTFHSLIYSLHPPYYIACITPVSEGIPKNIVTGVEGSLYAGRGCKQSLYQWHWWCSLFLVPLRASVERFLHLNKWLGVHLTQGSRPAERPSIYLYILCPNMSWIQLENLDGKLGETQTLFLVLLPVGKLLAAILVMTVTLRSETITLCSLMVPFFPQSVNSWQPSVIWRPPGNCEA